MLEVGISQGLIESEIENECYPDLGLIKLRTTTFVLSVFLEVLTWHLHKQVKDYYKILEIEFRADTLAVKKAYRRLALKYHPDRNNEDNAAQKFIEITEAYEVLRDPLKRSENDKLYETYFRTKSKDKKFEETNEQTYQRKQQEWAHYGRTKAKEYSLISFEEFSRQLLREISVGAVYITNVFAILLVGGLIIGSLSLLPKAFEDGNGPALFLLLMIGGLIYLTYRLFIVALADYKVDRKRKFVNKK